MKCPPRPYVFLLLSSSSRALMVVLLLLLVLIYNMLSLLGRAPPAPPPMHRRVVVTNLGDRGHAYKHFFLLLMSRSSPSVCNSSLGRITKNKKKKLPLNITTSPLYNISFCALSQVLGRGGGFNEAIFDTHTHKTRHTQAQTSSLEDVGGYLRKYNLTWKI